MLPRSIMELKLYCQQKDKRLLNSSILVKKPKGQRTLVSPPQTLLASRSSSENNLGASNCSFKMPPPPVLEASTSRLFRILGPFSEINLMFKFPSFFSKILISALMFCVRMTKNLKNPPWLYEIEKLRWSNRTIAHNENERKYLACERRQGSDRNSI